MSDTQINITHISIEQSTKNAVLINGVIFISALFDDLSPIADKLAGIHGVEVNRYDLNDTESSKIVSEMWHSSNISIPRAFQTLQ